MDLCLTQKEKIALQKCPKIAIFYHPFYNYENLINSMTKYGSIKKATFSRECCFVHYWTFNSVITAIKNTPLDYKGKTGNCPVVVIANDAMSYIEELPKNEPISPVANISCSPKVYEPEFYNQFNTCCEYDNGQTVFLSTPDILLPPEALPALEALQAPEALPAPEVSEAPEVLEALQPPAVPLNVWNLNFEQYSICFSSDFIAIDYDPKKN